MTALTQERLTFDEIQDSSLAIHHIDDPEALINYRDDWNQLVAGNSVRTVELTYEWQMTFWKHYGKTDHLFVVIVVQGERVVGIAPLKISRIRKMGMPVRQLEFIAARESNYQDFLIRNNASGIREHILNYLYEHRHEWDMFYAHHIPETSATILDLRQAFQGEFHHRLVAQEQCVFTVVDKSWDDHTTTLSKKSRAQIRNRQNRLNRLGTVTSTRCTDATQITGAMQTFINLHRKRWNPTNTPSQFNDAQMRNFYLEVSPKLCANQHLEMFALHLDDQTIGMMYVFRYQHEALIQLICYEPQLSKAAPSVVMHESFMQNVFTGQTFDIVDFGNYHAYKELWVNQFKTRLNIEIYNKRPKLSFVYVIVNNEKHLREALKSIKPLRRFVRAIKRRLHFVMWRFSNSITE